MRKSFKNLTLAVVALGAFSLTACMSSGSSVAVNDDKNATVFVSAKMKNVNTLSKPGLGKLTPITLTTLRITAVSNIAGPKAFGEDSVVVEYEVGDTLDIVGPNPEDTIIFTNSATTDIEFSRELSLRPLRSWTITVVTLDDQGDVIQSGTANLGQLFAGQVKGVSVNAGALYDNYSATFNFADSITSATGTISRQDIKVTSFSMKILSDSAFDTAAVRANGVTVNVDHVLNIYKIDSVKAGDDQDSVYLKVYGFLPQGPANGGTASNPILLYEGAKAFADLSRDNATTATLAWKGPTTGVADMTVSISKVGTIEIEVVTPPDVID